MNRDQTSLSLDSSVTYGYKKMFNLITQLTPTASRKS